MREKKSERWLLIAIVLIACNLRAAITGVGSLVGMIQRDLSLSSTVSGLITTIPLLAFAAVSPLASGLAQKRGLEKRCSPVLWCWRPAFWCALTWGLHGCSWLVCCLAAALQLAMC